MGIEIERKFLLRDDSWRAGACGVAIKQAYLAFGPPFTVRVRIHGDEANINVKTSTTSIRRGEYEYAIPMADAEQLMAGIVCGSVIDKTRYAVEFAGMTWEVDVFHGDNDGLIVAEIELDSEDQPFEKPPWAGEEVSHDPRYLNSHLARTPYSAWPR